MNQTNLAKLNAALLSSGYSVEMNALKRYVIRHGRSITVVDTWTDLLDTLRKMTTVRI